jgi:hypothetical protein
MNGLLNESSNYPIYYKFQISLKAKSTYRLSVHAQLHSPFLAILVSKLNTWWIDRYWKQMSSLPVRSR